MKALITYLMALFVSGHLIAEEAPAPVYFTIDKDKLNEMYQEAANSFAEAKTGTEASKYISDDNYREFNRAYRQMHKKRVGELAEEVKVFSRDLKQYALILNKWPNGKQGFVFLIWHQGMTEPKVDWRATYAYCDIEWDRLREEKPELPVEMRVRLRKNNYYNFGFADDQVWQCFSMYHVELEESMYVYLRRDHAQYEEIMNLFRGDRDSSVVLQMAYPADNEKDNQLEFLNLVSDTWFVK